MQTHPFAEGRMAEIFAWDEGRVLKLFRGNWPGEAKHEFSSALMAHARGAHTPQPFEIVEVEGRPGIIYERVEGPSMLQALAKRPYRVKALACEFAALQHTVHRCRVPELHAVRPALRDAINRGDTLSPPVQEAVLRLLDSLPDDDTLCHGDFHPDNVILSPKGPVIIDWPNAARGCPLADVARTMVMLRFGHPVQQISLWLRLAMMLVRRLFIAEYLRSYFKQSPYTPQQLPLWEIVLAAHRLREHIPGEAEFLVNFVESRLRSLNLV